MIALTKKVYNEILELPSNEKIELADRLLLNLTPIDNSVDKAWLLESERRLKEYRDGNVEVIPGDQVFENIHKRFGKKMGVKL